MQPSKVAAIRSTGGLTGCINGDVAAAVMGLVRDDRRLLAVREAPGVVQARVPALGLALRRQTVGRVVRPARAVAQRRVRDAVDCRALGYA